MRQRILVFLKLYPIARTEIAAAERAFPEVLGFGQGRTADLPADDGPARDRIIDARDFHLVTSKQLDPGIASEALTSRRGASPFEQRQFLYCPGNRPPRPMSDQAQRIMRRPFSRKLLL
jgi:hypothetical protein